jgi:hypothetical protein
VLDECFHDFLPPLLRFSEVHRDCLLQVPAPFSDGVGQRNADLEVLSLSQKEGVRTSVGSFLRVISLRGRYAGVCGTFRATRQDSCDGVARNWNCRYARSMLKQLEKRGLSTARVRQELKSKGKTETIRNWWLERRDGTPIGPKEIVQRITGVRSTTFHTYAVLPWFERHGFKLKRSVKYAAHAKAIGKKKT